MNGDRLKNRRDIGRVVFLAEQMAAARELSSCCVGTEALLESRTGAQAIRRWLGLREKQARESDD